MMINFIFLFVLLLFYYILKHQPYSDILRENGTCISNGVSVLSRKC